MMDDLAIRVENLSKQYQIGAAQPRYYTLRDQIVQGARQLVRPERQRGENNTIWALRDVSFDVRRGEVLGIIGRNGAGKSTLLKILSRITDPTRGRALIYGRVGSLLEVGTGFHPELTGRENITLNGAILGMRRAEIARKFDEIVDFAGVEKFIDTPVKRYSSGMYVRLAFAVAAHLEPEILLVDEVLAVGDAEFQKKCLGKMGEVAQGGRTVLFVSHNMAAVLNLCGRAIVLDQGRTEYIGSVDLAVSAYVEAMMRGDGQGGSLDLDSHPARRPGCHPLLRRVRLLGRDGDAKTVFSSGEMMKIELSVAPVVQLSDPHFGIGVDDWTGTRVFSLITQTEGVSLPELDSPTKVVCTIDELPLVPGRYTLSLSAGTYSQTLLDALDSVIGFDVEAGDFFRSGKIPPARLGKVLVRSRWETCE